MTDFLNDFFNELIDWLLYGLSYVVGILYGIIKAIFALLVDVLKKLFEWFFDLFELLFDAVGISQYVDVLEDDITGDFGYILELFLVPEALSASVLALLLRFFIRRLPVIG